MPAHFPRPCTYPGCRTLTRDGTGRCEKHYRPPFAPAVPTVRVRGRQLQELRRRLFQANPLCVQCEAQGRVTLATERDHIVALAYGGTDDESNTQGLCKACHEAKSQAESHACREAG